MRWHERWYGPLWHVRRVSLAHLLFGDLVVVPLDLHSLDLFVSLSENLDTLSHLFGDVYAVWRDVSASGVEGASYMYTFSYVGVALALFRDLSVAPEHGS